MSTGMTEGEALRRLLRFFYVEHNGEVNWSYKEYVTLTELDEELSEYVKPIIESNPA